MTQEKALELFEYKDGVLYSKVQRGRFGRIKIGDKIGGIDVSTNYIVARVSGKKQFIHRIIFLMFNGFCPERVDHYDCNPTNNKIENLRAATHSQNLSNRGKAKNNTSGFKGVCWDKRRGKWFAQIQSEGKQINIGHYDTPELAHEAYKAAALIHHKEFANV